MASPGGHNGHPIQVRPPRMMYRFFATALPASMWFFVRQSRITKAFLESVQLTCIQYSFYTERARMDPYSLAGDIHGSIERRVSLLAAFSSA